ncbi:MAG: universal stress protein [Acetobacteraceae bacterium]
MSDPVRILVPTDGSDHSRRAIEHVLDMAAKDSAVEIHLLNVQPPVRGAAATMVSQADLEAYHREEGMKVLSKSASAVEAAGITPHLHVGVGNPADIVLDFARRLGCRQIVMGTRGLGAVGSLLLGSVARDVAGAAEIPVTLLR